MPTKTFAAPQVAAKDLPSKPQAETASPPIKAKEPNVFDVNAAFTFLKPDGSEAKPPYERSWTGLEKVHVVEQLERALMKAMLKMNGISADVNRGKTPKPSTTNPVEVRLVAEVLEDGTKWTKVTFEWPKMGEEQQALLIGIVDGELAGAVESDTKSAEKQKSKKKKDK